MADAPETDARQGERGRARSALRELYRQEAVELRRNIAHQGWSPPELCGVLISASARHSSNRFHRAVAAEFEIPSPMGYLLSETALWPFEMFFQLDAHFLEWSHIAYVFWLSSWADGGDARVTFYPSTIWKDLAYAEGRFDAARVCASERHARGNYDDDYTRNTSLIYQSVTSPDVQVAFFPIHQVARAHWVLVVALLDREPDTGHIARLRLVYLDSLATTLYSQTRPPPEPDAVIMVRQYITDVAHGHRAPAPRRRPIEFLSTIMITGGQVDGWTCGYHVTAHMLDIMRALKAYPERAIWTPEELESVLPCDVAPGTAVVRGVQDWVIAATGQLFLSHALTHPDEQTPEDPARRAQHEAAAPRATL